MRDFPVARLVRRTVVQILRLGLSIVMLHRIPGARIGIFDVQTDVGTGMSALRQTVRQK